MHCDAHPILLIHPLMTLRSWLCLSCHLLLALCVCLAVSAALRRLRPVQSLPSSARCVARLGESPIVEVMTPAMDGDQVMVYDCQLAPDSAASHPKRHIWTLVCDTSKSTRLKTLITIVQDGAHLILYISVQVIWSFWGQTTVGPHWALVVAALLIKTCLVKTHIWWYTCRFDLMMYWLYWWDCFKSLS